MQRILLVVLLVSCCAVVAPACGDGGGADDAGLDGGTDADTDTDTDSDADAGPDGGTACVVYVNGAGGDDGNAGMSWASALATVQAGLNLAEGAGCDVWVAAGIYLPGTARSDTFGLRAGVALYGGFSGDESGFGQRDFLANETILSGDIGAAGDNSDNSYHVVTGADGATIDGFTITGGNADGEHPDNYGGGGMYNDNAASIVANCTFSDNTANIGGGMYNVNASPVVTNCTFSGNSVGGGGGGMLNDSSSPMVTNCTFVGNLAPNGGGGMDNVYSSSPTVTNCTFSGNFKGGIYNYMAGELVLTNCTFYGNLDGGGGGGAITVAEAGADVSNCILWGNGSSEYFYQAGGSITINHSDFPGGSVAFAGEGNIDAEPLFVNDDVDAGPLDLRLQPGSPCIDTGSNEAIENAGVTTDLDGNPRIVDGNGDDVAIVDMGAYEFQP